MRPNHFNIGMRHYSDLDDNELIQAFYRGTNWTLGEYDAAKELLARGRINVLQKAFEDREAHHCTRGAARYFLKIKGPLPS